MLEQRPVRKQRERSRISSGFLLAALSLVLSPAPVAFAGVCSAGAFSCPASGLCTVTGTWSIGAGCVLDFGPRPVEVKGTLQAETVGGSFTIKASDLTLNAGKLKSLGDVDDGGGDIRVDLSGNLTMKGTGPRIDTSGNGGGGAIRVNAANISLTSGVIAADGGSGATCGDAGVIELVADSGPLTAETTIHSTTPGNDCGGGEVALRGATVTLSADIDARGGAWASDNAITIIATAGDIVASGSASLKADGMGQPDGFGADGGGVALIADSGAVSLGAASVTATGSSPDGGGGEVYVSAAGNVDISARTTAYGGGDGVGGHFSAESGGQLTLSGDVVATGGESYPGSEGGWIQLDSSGQIVVSSLLDVSAAEGGMVAIDNFDLASVSGQLVARGSRGPGGRVDMMGCDIEVTGTLDAGSSNGGLAGEIDLVSRAILIGSTALVRALPCTATSCIDVTAGPGWPIIAPAAVVDPAPLITLDPDLPPC